MKLPFFTLDPSYSIAVDAPPLSPWLHEGVCASDVKCIDVRDLNVIEAANKVRGSIRVLLLQDADDGRAEELIGATLPLMILRVQPRRSFSDSQLFKNYRLSLEQTMSQDALGSPFMGWVTVSVFTPEDREVSPLVATHGPTAPLLESGAPRLWSIEAFGGYGKDIERENATLSKYLQDAIHGLVPLPLQAGLPNLLPNEPLSLTSDGEDIIGYIASATDAPGQFMALSQVEVATILGYSLSSDEVRNLDFSSLISNQFAREILKWVNKNISND